jgi:hypothetical protein
MVFIQRKKNENLWGVWGGWGCGRLFFFSDKQKMG